MLYLLYHIINKKAVNSVYLSHLTLHNFRNFKEQSLEFSQDGALFRGLNGSGKTNLLEAMHVVCTGRSQRAASRRNMINSSASCYFIEAGFKNAESGNETIASMGFGRDRKSSMKINDKKVSSFSEWFGIAGIVSFGPDDLNLIYGPPHERRRFVDILISQLVPGYLGHCVHYRKSLLNRNKLLGMKICDMQLDAYEEKMAFHGAELAEKRNEIIRKVESQFTEFYRQISRNKETGTIKFQPSFSSEFNSKKEWKYLFLEALKNTRKQDCNLGYSSIGPHRDDVRITIDGRPARNFGSLGQCRSLSLALRLCSYYSLKENSGDSMILLVDDVFSELDDQRLKHFYPLIESGGQLFATASTSRVPFSKPIHPFTISDGKVCAG
ncbi:MAG: DNA replication and repair protein RecF [Chitinivibrionales bacterium]|nr:DNA replication and repair protein RecF [Chitinivibrionales bacterium]